MRGHRRTLPINGIRKLRICASAFCPECNLPGKTILSLPFGFHPMLLTHRYCPGLSMSVSYVWTSPGDGDQFQPVKEVVRRSSKGTAGGQAQIFPVLSERFCGVAQV